MRIAGCSVLAMAVYMMDIDGMKKEVKRCCEQEIVPIVRRITLWSIVTNLLLSLLKFVVGVLGHSQAIVADAIHSLSDTTTDLALFVGVKFWSAPADENHPYGHWRLETVVTVAIGLMLALVAVGISYRALFSMKDGVSTVPGLITLVAAVLSIVVKEFLYQWTARVGRKTNSSALMANAWHHRSDAFSSIPVVVSIVVARSYPSLRYADEIGAMVVSLFVLYAAWKIVRDAFGELLDESAEVDVRDQVESVVLKVDGVESVHAIRTRRMGPGIYLDLHLLVDGDLTVREGHDISENVRRELLSNGPNVLDAVVHLEPVGDTEARLVSAAS